MEAIEKPIWPLILRETLKPHPMNPREHDDDQLQLIAMSIDTFDWQKPIVISLDNYILAGHGAVLASEGTLYINKEGIETYFECNEIPYKRFPFNHDHPLALAYMVADNKTTDESDWNLADLGDVFNELISKNDNFEKLTTFDETEIENIIGSGEPTDAPEAFPTIPEKLETDYTCPKCGYSWSGKPN